MYQDAQIEVNPQVDAMAARINALNVQLKNANEAIANTRTIVRDWLIEKFDGRGAIVITFDEANELLDSIDAKPMVRFWDVKMVITVTAQVEADSEEEAIETLDDDLKINGTEYEVEWETTDSSATEA